MFKKSQVWTIDLISGITIFLAVIIIYFIMTNNVVGNTRVGLQDITYETSTVSETLLSIGDPPGWDSGNVIFIGLTDGDYRYRL